MSADQGSASSELRLGDYAYYGWGVAVDFGGDAGANGTSEAPETDASGDDELESELGDVLMDPELRFFPQGVKYETALGHYRKTAEMQVTGEWMQAFVARAAFNVGFMHQFGLGVPQDLHLAKRNYQRSVEVDPGGVHAPVQMMLLLLHMHSRFMQMPEFEELKSALLADLRFHLLVLNFVALVALLLVRKRFAGATPPEAAAAPEGRGAPPQVHRRDLAPAEDACGGCERRRMGG